MPIRFRMMSVAIICSIMSVAQVTRLDLNDDHARQVTVDREAGVYLGHVSTVLLDDKATILAAYPKGHGQGSIVLKKSTDGGRTWSERLPTPASWETSKETPTLFNLGGGGLILFSGLYPIRAARSADSGETWSELTPIGDFGGIVAMGCMIDRGGGRFAAVFHDDGRFIDAAGAGPKGTFTIYQTTTEDSGKTWSMPRSIWSGTDIHLCEPGDVRSPDGTTLALLLRENRRIRNSHVMFSKDQAATWSQPRELPRCLTGDRHIAGYASDGRLVITFRCMAAGDPWRGDWVAWIGTWDDLENAAAASEGSNPPEERGTCLVRLKDNLTEWDCGYAGLVSLPDGEMVATTYGSWVKDERPFILCFRLSMGEVDRRLREMKAE